MNRALGESGYTVLGLGNTMAPTRALIKSFSSQHPQHASTGINPSSNKKNAVNWTVEPGQDPLNQARIGYIDIKRYFRAIYLHK
jgi:hypothetical protein